jgi:hypothetical protein
MPRPALFCIAALALAAPGCAGIQFHEGPRPDAFTYYEPAPFAVIKKAADCSLTVETLVLPGKKRSLSMRSGLGSAKLSVKTANGIITEIGQETDTKIPETLTALSGLAKAFDGEKALPSKGCTPSVELRALVAAEDGLTFSEPRLTYESVVDE